MSEEPIVICPHCKEFVLIEKINCAIFRHGCFKSSGKQIKSHLSKELCDFYIEKNLIYGCGRPFKIINNNGKLETEICDYI
jgi:G:T-mismatch repair DNA endonuclease (very short patch repair protein)